MGKEITVGRCKLTKLGEGHVGRKGSDHWGLMGNEESRDCCNYKNGVHAALFGRGLPKEEMLG